jgi:hypothetical protein
MKKTDIPSRGIRRKRKKRNDCGFFYLRDICGSQFERKVRHRFSCVYWSSLVKDSFESFLLDCGKETSSNHITISTFLQCGEQNSLVGTSHCHHHQLCGLK